MKDFNDQQSKDNSWDPFELGELIERDIMKYVIQLVKEKVEEYNK